LAIGPKAEFPPLLTAGFHLRTVDDLYALTVTAIGSSKTRPKLWPHMLWLVAQLRARWLPCTLWVDGSFMTEKIDPDDIDLVLEFDIRALSNVTPDQRQFLEDLSNNKYHGPPWKLHTFIIYSAPLMHPARTASIALRNQWERDFGLSFVKKEPKGIATLEVRP
jgi:hypothetical protein